MAARVLSKEVVGATFSVYTEDEVRRLSVKALHNPTTFDAFNLPNAECVVTRHACTSARKRARARTCVFLTRAGSSPPPPPPFQRPLRPRNGPD
jgi:hypothetical protein